MYFIFRNQLTVSQFMSYVTNTLKICYKYLNIFWKTLTNFFSPNSNNSCSRQQQIKSDQKPKLV